jgi:hypothetical protein
LICGGFSLRRSCAANFRVARFRYALQRSLTSIRTVPPLSQVTGDTSCPRRRGARKFRRNENSDHGDRKVSKTYSRAIFCVAIAMALSSTALANESMYKQVLPSTVFIITPRGHGSGVLVDVDRKLVATNFHVVGLENEVTVVFPVVKDQAIVVEKDFYLKDLKTLGVKAKVKVRDPRRDLALIELKAVPNGATALKLASQASEPGQTVHSLGNPGVSDALWVYSTGSIRQVYAKRFVMNGQVVESRVIETQTPVNPGDSGGPVVNQVGELVALSCALRRDSSLFSLCIDVSELKDLLQGKVKSIDQQVADTLESLHFKYKISAVGNYLVDVPMGDGRQQVVVVDSVTWPRGPIRVRQVRTYVPVPEASLAADLALRLMKRDDVLVFGSWKCFKSEGKDVLVYRTIVPATGEPDTLREALLETVRVAEAASREIAGIAAQQKLLKRDDS